MNTKPLLLGVVALATASCSTMEGMMGMVTVPGPIQVTITVAAGPPEKCTITQPAKIDEVHVPKGQYDLTWNLSGPSNYRFDQQIGITFPQSGSSNFFTTKSVSNQTFVITDTNTTANAKGKHPYHIHVESLNGSVKCKLDPSVINDDTEPYSR